jgi:hypothetical protein
MLRKSPSPPTKPVVGADASLIGAASNPSNTGRRRHSERTTERGPAAAAAGSRHYYYYSCLMATVVVVLLIVFFGVSSSSMPVSNSNKSNEAILSSRLCRHLHCRTTVQHSTQYELSTANSEAEAATTKVAAMKAPASSASISSTKPSSATTTTRLLRIVSMNIAELRPSDEAPDSWKINRSNDNSQETVIAAAFRQQLLLASDANSSNGDDDPPHVIFLQECPREQNAAWITDTLLGTENNKTSSTSSDSSLSDYISMGTRPSHAGFVTLLVRHDFVAHQPLMRLSAISSGSSSQEPRAPWQGDPDEIPAVVAQLSFRDDDDDEEIPQDEHQPDELRTSALSSSPPSLILILASVHLAPFESGASQRRFQMQQLLQIQANVLEKTRAAAAANNKDNNNKTRVVLLVAGDTNMRDSEDAVMQDELHFQDAWKLAGSNPTTQYTWDTTIRQELSPTSTNATNNRNSLDGMTTPPPPPTRTIQNRYYGQHTRAYQRRYDRIYIHSGDHPLHHGQQQQQQQQQEQQHDESFSVKVRSFALVANEPIEPSRFHFLSDHFGIHSEFEFSW